MPEGNDPAGPSTVSQEAHDRVVRENAALKEQIGTATSSLVAYQKRDAARRALVGKVADPDSVADLITPHLADVEVSNIGEHIDSESFAPRLAAFAPASSVPPAPTGAEGELPTAPTEPANGFGNPSPGQDGGTQPPGEKAMIKFGSPEFKDLLAKSPEAVEQAYKDGRVQEPQRPW